MSDGSSGEHQASTVLPHIPSVIDLASHRRISLSILLSSLKPVRTGFTSSKGHQATMVLTPMVGGNGGGSPHHMRSLSHMPLSLMDSASLPSYADLAAPVVMPLTSPSVTSNHGLFGLSPPLAGHKRSQSDTPLGSLQQNLQMLPLMPIESEDSMIEGHQSRDAAGATLNDLINSCMNSKGLGVLGSSGVATQEKHEQLGSQAHGPQVWSNINSSKNEAGNTGVGRTPHHCHSLSVHSLMRTPKFGAIGQEMSSPPPLSTRAGTGGSLSCSGSGSILFSEAEKNKIMADKYLSDILLTDPKRVKRILSNRASAARSKDRKAKYMAELQRKVKLLQMKVNMLYSQVTTTKRRFDGLLSENIDLKIRMEMMVPKAQLIDDLNEALTAEVQRLQANAGQFSDSYVPNGSHQQVSSPFIQLQQLQTQWQPLQPQQDQPQETWNF